MGTARRGRRMAAATAAWPGSRQAGNGLAGCRWGKSQTAPLTGRNTASNGPRRAAISAVDALATRTKIIERAVEVASTAGLEGLTIGNLAGDLGMSKAGVLGHFGSKEALQLAALDAAVRA